MKLTVALFTAMILVAAGSALGHHEERAFDLSKSISVEGQITQFRMGTPHSEMKVTGTAPQGAGAAQSGAGNNTSAEKMWIVELPARAELEQLDWNENTFKAGDIATITGSPAKEAGDRMWAKKIVVAGKEYDLTQRITGTQTGTSEIAQARLPQGGAGSAAQTSRSTTAQERTETGAASEELPDTASPLPLIALIGVILLATAAALRVALRA
jgi:hypothetical protein